METCNLQEIQEMTCIAISKQDWVKNVIQQIKDAKTAILHLTEVQCNMTKAICTGDEEEKRLISEEMDVIIGNLPEY